MTTRYSYLERWTTDLHVVAEWDNSQAGGDLSGPRRLVIELTRPVPAGLTSELMRRANRHVGEMTDEFHEVLSVGGHRRMVLQYAEDCLAVLPPDGDEYHRGLLTIHAELAGCGASEPVSVLAGAMRVPTETMHACLEVARRRLGHG